MKTIFKLIVVAILYVSMSEMNGRRKAEEFCEAIHVGDAAENLQQNAVSSGARKRDTVWLSNGSSGSVLPAKFTGALPGSDYICVIKANEGSVVSKNIFYTSLIPK